MLIVFKVTISERCQKRTSAHQNKFKFCINTSDSKGLCLPQEGGGEVPVHLPIYLSIYLSIYPHSDAKAFNNNFS